MKIKTVICAVLALSMGSVIEVSAMKKKKRRTPAEKARYNNDKKRYDNLKREFDQGLFGGVASITCGLFLLGIEASRKDLNFSSYSKPILIGSFGFISLSGYCFYRFIKVLCSLKRPSQYLRYISTLSG